MFLFVCLLYCFCLFVFKSYYSFGELCCNFVSDYFVMKNYVGCSCGKTTCHFPTRWQPVSYNSYNDQISGQREVLQALSKGSSPSCSSPGSGACGPLEVAGSLKQNRLLEPSCLMMKKKTVGISIAS